MTITLYMTPLSPPVRAVLITAEALGIQLEVKKMDLAKNDHLRPEYLKLNPQHTIPTLVDGDTVIWDSHAIAAYLVRKYGNDDSLYPKDFSKRAVVDQRLHFDTGVLFSSLRETLGALIYKGQKGIKPEQIDAANKGYEFLEKFLEHSCWVAGNVVTIADICIFATVSSWNKIVPVDANKFPNIIRWMKQTDDVSYFKVNSAGLEELNEFAKMLLSKK